MFVIGSKEIWADPAFLSGYLGIPDSNRYGFSCDFQNHLGSQMRLPPFSPALHDIESLIKEWMRE